MFFYAYATRWCCFRSWYFRCYAADIAMLTYAIAAAIRHYIMMLLRRCCLPCFFSAAQPLILLRLSLSAPLSLPPVILMPPYAAAIFRCHAPALDFDAMFAYMLFDAAYFAMPLSAFFMLMPLFFAYFYAMSIRSAIVSLFRFFFHVMLHVSSAADAAFGMMPRHADIRWWCRDMLRWLPVFRYYWCLRCYYCLFLFAGFFAIDIYAAAMLLSPPCHITNNNITRTLSGSRHIPRCFSCCYAMLIILWALLITLLRRHCCYAAAAMPLLLLSIDASA